MSTTPTPKRPDDYAESDAAKVDHARRTIALLLGRYHRGRDNAVPSKQLAEAVGLKATTVRDLIPEVMAEHDLPIGTANGYFVIEDKREYARQVKRQLRQAETSRKRAELLEEAYDYAE